ncbi:MAG: hypothetical protein E6J43_12270 [Chloroflexi bacterium]|nr:MAG: hypothetical protein E6J43_12270 [Chloroflexota bacterium]
MEKGRRKRRRKGNYYLSKSMASEDRAELRRADQVEGLADEIAMLRMRIKRALVDEEEDLEILSMGLDRLSRAVGMQHKMHPQASEELFDSLEAILDRFPDLDRPPPAPPADGEGPKRPLGERE